MWVSPIIKHKINQYWGALLLVLLALAYLMPNHYFPWTAFHSELLACLALVVAFAILAVWGGGSVRFGLLPIAIAVCCAIPFVQYGFGLLAYFGDALMCSLYLMAFLGAYSVGATKKENNLDWLQYFCWAIYSAGIISAGIAVLQWLRLDNSFYIGYYNGSGRAGANLAQPNNLATLLLMSGVAAGYLCCRQYLKLWMFWCSLIVLLVAVCMTQSRTALVSALGLYLAFNFVKPSGLQRKYAVLISTVVFVTFVILFLNFYTIGQALHLLPTEILNTVERTGANELRASLWKQLIDSLYHYPLLGFGWGQVAKAQMLGSNAVGIVWLEYSHNILLDLLLWNGVIIGSAIIIALLFWLVKVVRCPHSLHSWALISLALPIVSHSMFEFPFAYAFFLLPLGFLLGQLDLHKKGWALFTLYLGPWFYGLAAALSLSITCLVAHEYFKYEALLKDIRFKAANIVGFTVVLPNSQWMFLTQLKAFAEFTQTLATKNMSDAELLKMQQVAYRYPMPPVLFRYALALKLNNKDQEANRMMEKIYSFNGEPIYCEAIQNMQLMGFYQNGLPIAMGGQLPHCKN